MRYQRLLRVILQFAFVASGGIFATSGGYAQEFRFSDQDSSQVASNYSRGSETWRLEFEFLTWWVSSANCSPLLTTSADGSARAEAGTLDNSTTSVLFGGKIDGGVRSGGRAKVARSLTDDTDVYFAGTYLADDYQSGSLFASSTGIPILARPFTDAQTGLQNSELVAFPAVLTGTIAIDNYSELYTSDIGLSKTLLQGTNGQLFVRSGYRFLSYRDEIAVREDLTSIDLGGAVPLDTGFIVRDSFNVNNVFHGGAIGLGIDSSINQWTYLLSADVSLGALSRRLTVDGYTDVSVPTLPTTTSTGGLLAQPTNIGTYRSQSFAALPEFNVKVGRIVGKRLSLNLGYTFMLIPEVYRASEQIDLVVNQSQIGGNTLVGAARPAVSLTKRDMWIQGISYGLTFRF